MKAWKKPEVEELSICETFSGKNGGDTEQDVWDWDGLIGLGILTVRRLFGSYDDFLNSWLAANFKS